MAVYDEWEAANARVAGLSLDALTHTDLLELQHRREVVVRSMPAVDHQIINRLAAEADPKALGGTNLADVLATKLRISKQEARRRVKQAELLGPRQAITGEPLAPTLANTAAAQAQGQIGLEHVRIVEQFFDDLPSHIDSQTRDQAEADLARMAKGLGPTQFRAAADRLALLLNQDGEPPHDAEHARRRYLTMEKQGIDGMSRIHGLLDPECRATVEAVLAKWAAPGMCNPDDAAPCVDGEPSEEAVQGDTRSAGQRNHDALTAIGRSVLASGELGQHNGLPTTIDRVNRRLNKHGLPFFFQYAVGGAIATAPPLALYVLSPKLGLQFEPTVAIAAGLVVLLAGLSLVSSVGDVITGAPVTAAGRFFELVMMTAATIAGVALVLHLASRFGAPYIAISANAPPALAELAVRVAFGAASAAAFALACYAERTALVAAAFGGAAGTIGFLLAQSAGVGVVVASFVAAVPVGLVGRLMERRNLAPPLIVSISGIVPLLPGLSLLHGIYAVLNDQLAVGFASVLGALAISTALAAGVTLGEWGSWRVRKRRLRAPRKRR